MFSGSYERRRVLKVPFGDPISYSIRHGSYPGGERAGEQKQRGDNTPPIAGPAMIAI
jgi:hypothetical protein